MFKKTLIAAALTLAAGQANAFDWATNGDAITSQKVATQSTQTVLQFQKGSGSAIFDLEANTDVTATVFLRVELSGGATWNLTEVKAADMAVVSTADVFDEANAELLAPNVLRIPATAAVAAAETLTVDFAHTGMFNLTEATGKVYATVSLQSTDGSFTGEPLQASEPAFELVNVLSASVPTVSSKTAKVTYQYKQFDDLGDKTLAAPVLEIVNQTTSQTINDGTVSIKLVGDFSDVESYDQGAVGLGNFELNKEKTELTADVTAVLGNGANNVTLPTLVFTGENPIKDQEFEVSVAMKANATFSAFDVADILAYNVERDGFTFETVTTGTTASNQIFIRDVSGNVPAEGAAINVTVTEYDAEGKGTVIADTQPLTTKLANNGAVTLTPAQITAELGVDATPASQARFEFFVETEEGRAAVKKQQAGVGIDIQTGAHAGAVL